MKRTHLLETSVSPFVSVSILTCPFNMRLTSLVLNSHSRAIYSCILLTEFLTENTLRDVGKTKHFGWHDTQLVLGHVSIENVLFLDVFFDTITDASMYTK